jgi:hypothetical protein
MTEEAEATKASVDGDFVGEATASLKESLPESLLLSQALGPSPAPGQPRAYIPPTSVVRSETREVLHQRAIKDVAAQRFQYPTEEHRDLKTYVNHPARTMGVQMPDGSVAYPDIVVVQHPENNARIVAQIETAESIREAVARFEWLPYSRLAPLYLFVPVGKGEDARELCKQFGVQAVGIRTWRYLPGYDEIEINES